MRFISSRVKALLKVATLSNTFVFFMIISTIFIVGCASYGIILLNARIAHLLGFRSSTNLFNDFEFGLLSLLAEVLCAIVIWVVVSLCTCCVAEDLESYRKSPTYRT